MNPARVALDTNALTALIAGDREVMVAMANSQPLLPVVVLQEALYGWILQGRKGEQRGREDLIGRAMDQLAALHEMARLIPVLRYTALAQDHYQLLRSSRGSRGRQDLRIAAICIAHGVPLLSRNRSDFEDLPGLRLVGW